jgi:hypothetical protein
MPDLTPKGPGLIGLLGHQTLVIAVVSSDSPFSKWTDLQVQVYTLYEYSSRYLAHSPYYRVPYLNSRLTTCRGFFPHLLTFRIFSTYSYSA